MHNQLLLQSELQSGKLTNNFVLSPDRYYFDFNATSPLADSVKGFLAKGDFYCNPSSAHSSGRFTKSKIFEVKEYIQQLFSWNGEILFHSGATEFINTFFKQALVGDQKYCCLYQATDHSAVLKVMEFLNHSGVKTICIPSLSDGTVDFNFLKKTLHENSQATFLINFTLVNNETGVVQNFLNLQNSIQGFKVFLHLDAVQSIGKIINWNHVPSIFHAITFSNHKFGGLTGSGFTLLKSDFIFSPLIHGGNQQASLRSGTENILGILSLPYALKSAPSNAQIQITYEARKIIEDEILRHFQDSIILLGSGSQRASNTMNLILKTQSSDITFIQFDQAGIDISVGSACASGRFKSSHVVEAMGFPQYKNHSLRFSFSPYLKADQAMEYAKNICTIFQRIL